MPWTSHPYYTAILDAMCARYKINTHIPYSELKREERNRVLYGTDQETYEISHDMEKIENKTFKTKYEGVIPNLLRRYRESDHEVAYMIRIAHFVTEIDCPECEGHRLKREYLNVKVDGLNI